MKDFPSSAPAAGWLRDSLIQPSLLAKIIVRHLTNINLQFDSIAVQGYSATIVSSAVAAIMDKEIIVVRKPGEQRHSGNDIEGVTRGRKFIIIDDFVDSGETVTRIIKGVKERGGEFVGLYTFQRIYNEVPEGLKKLVTKKQMLSTRIYKEVPYLEVPDGTYIYSGWFKSGYGNGSIIPVPKSDDIMSTHVFSNRGKEPPLVNELKVYVEMKA